MENKWTYSLILTNIYWDKIVDMSTITWGEIFLNSVDSNEMKNKRFDTAATLEMSDSDSPGESVFSIRTLYYYKSSLKF